MTAQKIIWLVSAGALGTLCRAAISTFVDRQWGPGYLWGTSVVNVLGCLLFGLVWALAERGPFPPAAVRWVVLTGFMGAFTTFSTYLFQTANLLEQGRYAAATLGFALQNGLGLGAVFLGMLLGRSASG